MKILWVENADDVREMLAITADKAARKRVQVDVVLAASLMSAETRLRLERFDLVILDLAVPDSMDADMAVTRIANMGKFRLGIISSCDEHEYAVEKALKHGVNVSPITIEKGGLPFRRFIQKPEEFATYMQALMPKIEQAEAPNLAAVA